MRLKHRSLIAITILQIITLGLYQFYWFFVTKTEMNVLNPKAYKVPFFLWFFVPIINIWWFWRFAKAIEKSTRDKVGRWTAFFAPVLFALIGGLILAFVFSPYNGEGLLTISRLGYSFVAVVVGLLPIYYFQSNLNKYAK